MIKFQHKLFEEELGQFAPRSVNLLILFGIRRNFLSRGRSRSQYLLIRRVKKHYIHYPGISILSTTYGFYRILFCQGYVKPLSIIIYIIYYYYLLLSILLYGKHVIYILKISFISAYNFSSSPSSCH